MLVVHTGGVGDLLCCLPALQGLAASRTLELAGIPERAALAGAAGIAERIHDLENSGFHSAFARPDDRLRAFAEPFGEALVWMADPDGLIAGNLDEAGIPDVRCIPGIPPADWTRHAAHWYAQGAGVMIELPAQLDFGAPVASGEVIIQPGSGSAKKNWPLENFTALAEALRKAGHRVLWCLGPAEGDLAECRPALPAMPLTDLARTLAGAALFVGNDSGIGHLASLAGTPTIAIFGPTDPAVWRPAGPRVTVLRGRPWPDAAEVYEAALALLDKAQALNTRRESP